MLEITDYLDDEDEIVAMISYITITLWDDVEFTFIR
jgi:hypothetical protein